MVGNIGGRAAEKGRSSVIAQVQLPGAAQVEHAGERKHMRYGALKRCETEREMATGGVSGDAELFEVEPRDGIIFMFAQCAIGAADILKCSGPSAAGIAHAPVLDVPGGDTGLLQGVAKMSGVSEIIFRAPIAAVNEEDDWMRAFSGRNADVNELIWVLAVREAQIGLRRFLFQDGFTLHAKQYRTALWK